MEQRPGPYKKNQNNLNAAEIGFWKQSEIWCWSGMEKIKWSEKVTNEQVLDPIGENRTLINNILRRKSNWIGYILRRNFLHLDAIEGQMMEVQGVGRRRTFPR